MKRTRQDAEKTRIAIIAAAETVFYRHGYHQTTLETIAREARVSRGALYWHFDSKSMLLAELRCRIEVPNFAISNPKDAVSVSEISELIVSSIMAWITLVQNDRSLQRLLLIFLSLEGQSSGCDKIQISNTEKDADNQLAALFEVINLKADNPANLSALQKASQIKWLVKSLCWGWLHSDKLITLPLYTYEHVRLSVRSVCLQ